MTRIVSNPKVFGGKPIIRGRRLAVEHILAMIQILGVAVTQPERSVLSCPVKAA